MKNLFLGLVLFLVGCATGAPPSDVQAVDAPPELPRVNPAFAAKNAIFAMVASNTYHKAESERVRFPVEMLGWRQVDLNDQPTSEPTGTRWSGLAWDVYEKTGTNEVIFSFRGTDSKLDYLTASAMIWPFAIQYQQARKSLHEYRQGHPEKRITLTGHSLGGGLAAGLSVRKGIDTVIFDPSPRIFDGLGDKHQPAERVVIFQKGEVLTHARRLWPKLVRTFDPKSFYMTEFDFEGVNPHRMDQLALGLLSLGAKDDRALAAVLSATRPKIPSPADAKAAEAAAARP